VVKFFVKSNPDGESLKAFAQLELTRLERGVFLLDTVVGVAPLIGLLGTVYGLFSLFPQSQDGMPSNATLTRGVGLALTTTILGLLIAIPSLVFSSYIARRLEVHSARMNMLVERLLELRAAGVALATADAATAPPIVAQQPVPAAPVATPVPAALSASATHARLLPRSADSAPKLEFILKPLPAVNRRKPTPPPK
jgi:hypothetical protein